MGCQHFQTVLHHLQSIQINLYLPSFSFSQSITTLIVKLALFITLHLRGDYFLVSLSNIQTVKKEIFITLCQAWQITPTTDLFSTGENILVVRFMAIGEEVEGGRMVKRVFKTIERGDFLDPSTNSED
ncbi:MAG: hypothetical protein EZS28_027176 [Streblomastix strix]|uniref:Uncharacterized protein n=1 Tax=Streblomastix strix TaxID=222440 RepID=A0A5J4V2X2_9EUKA|nr:MAG: hypothetical protein EZS28_027176 [Streblomastix strix]